MCTNYAPVQRQVLRDIFGVEPPPAEWKPETWPDYARRDCAHGRRRPARQRAGHLRPGAALAHSTGARRYDTVNARSETVGSALPLRATGARVSSA